MKKISFVMFMAFAMLLTGCKKEETVDPAELLVGKWSLTDYKPAVKSAVIGSETISVTVSFFDSRRFSLEQTIGQAYVQHFEGTWTIDGNTLSGVYSDKKAWGESYTVSFSDNDNTLEMTTNTAHETYVYKRVEEKK